MNTRRNRTTGAFAAFVLAALLLGLSLVFASCGDTTSLPEPGESPAPIPKDQTATKMVITFKNGWEPELYAIGDAPDLEKDDPYTRDYTTKAVYPQKINATVNTQENKDYDASVAVYKENAKLWKEYDDKKEKGEEAVPPEGDQLAEPAAPVATLPYLPGSPIIDENDKQKIVGWQPEWDYHIFKGWLVYPYYPDAEGAYDIAENPAVSGNITMVAQWEAAPARPFVEITFEKADGSKAFEKRIAVPEKRTFEADNQSGAVGKLMDHDGKPDTPEIYVTENLNDAKGGTANPVIVKYENFKIKKTDVQGGTLAQNAPDLIPIFAREHYEIDSSKPWAGSAGAAINPSAYFEENTFVYQQWKPLQYTITFNNNGIGGGTVTFNDITGLDASKVVTGGVSAVGRSLPVYGGTVTSGAVDYKFDRWTDAAQGGNTYTGKTGINGNTTLYAQWNPVGGKIYTYGLTSKVQKFTTPEAGKYKIEAWGAQGGVAQSGDSSRGGKGGYSAGTITLAKGVDLFVYVGGQGANGTSTDGGNGGYNGGGKGGKSPTSYGGAGGGGGASDVRLKAASSDAASATDANSLKTRIIVAGGGGGAAYSNYGSGGYGGGATGGSATSYKSSVVPTGGGQTQSGAIANLTTGTFGAGAVGGNGSPTNGGWFQEPNGGGGGGYYGGNASQTLPGQNSGKFDISGGGGGSSYVKGLTSTPGNSAMMDNGTINFTGGITTANQNTGVGKVVISFIPN
ncbi:hypothetical protein AGMMS50212_00350 [Spirochaetia bacterium]|nr:hypothetical protein AGMMS50212_00350 [Spirochaetia bacterium]